MSKLRSSLAQHGFDDVSTYIASGNVIFESRENDGAKVEAKIEQAIEQRFRLPVKAVVLDQPGYARIVEAIPSSWLGDRSVRANVAFARRRANARQIARELQPDPAIEEVKAIDGAILWATKRDALNRSVMRRLIGGAAYKELTVRNLNTTLALHELLAA